MGQVPKYGLIGGGRVATHLAHYFRLLDVPFRQWTRSSMNVPYPAGLAFKQADPAASDNSGDIADSTDSTDFAETTYYGTLASAALKALSDCDVLLLAISDHSIEPLARAIRELKHPNAPTLVHFSGALTVEGVESVHPLMTFGPELYDREEYERIPFVVSREGRPFEELFPALRNPSHTIAEKDKALYHALCVMSGNFASILFSKAMNDFESRLGVPVEALHEYLTRTTANSLRARNRALTGPLARRDLRTIESNLNALGCDPYRRIYEAFVQVLIPTPNPSADDETRRHSTAARPAASLPSGDHA